MTIGPLPKITVLVRYILAKRSRISGGVVICPLATRIKIKEAKYVSVDT